MTKAAELAKIVDASGNVVTSGTVEPAGDTAAGDNAAIGFTSAEGIVITGQGSTNDVTIKNDADADVIEIPTGTTNVTIAGTLTATGFIIGSADINENDLESIDGITAGTIAASKAAIVDTNKDITGFRNITLTGELDAATLDVSGDADIDGTLEADAITVNGTALATVIAGTTVTTATNANHVSVTDNESTNEENLIPFIEDTSATGNVGLESDGDFAYNPSTGTVSATVFKGNIDAVDGDFDGTLEADAITIGGTAIASVLSPVAGSSSIVTTGALNSGSITSGFGAIDTGSSTITTTGAITGGTLTGTLQTAAQTNITSVGTLTSFRSTGIDDNADALAITIDSSERVLVGTTNAVIIGNGGIALKGADGRIDASANGGSSALFDRRTNDGDIVGLYKDGSAVGSIGVNSSDLAIYSTTSSHTGLRFGNGNIMPTDNSGGISDNTADLGESAYRFKNFYVAGNIYLGGTGTANALDDYEEGTWTPTVTDGSATGTLTSPSGFYTKIGNTVVADYSYTINDTSGLSSGSTLQIGGLPFTSINSFIGSQGSVRSQGFGTADNIPVVAEVLQNSNNIRYHFFSRNNSQRVLTVADISSGEFAAGQIIYKV